MRGAVGDTTCAAHVGRECGAKVQRRRAHNLPSARQRLAGMREPAHCTTELWVRARPARGVGAERYATEVGRRILHACKSLRAQFYQGFIGNPSTNYSYDQRHQRGRGAVLAHLFARVCGVHRRNLVAG
ncbi:MAG: hypothetical protein CL678_00745 [Bdellovibrionaceae bacterium]|nr:hypothetical protein [Pseudobdellovibrionaceae bacterium]